MINTWMDSVLLSRSLLSSVLGRRNRAVLLDCTSVEVQWLVCFIMVIMVRRQKDHAMLRIVELKTVYNFFPHVSKQLPFFPSFHRFILLDFFLRIEHHHTKGDKAVSKVIIASGLDLDTFRL